MFRSSSVLLVVLLVLFVISTVDGASKAKKIETCKTLCGAKIKAQARNCRTENKCGKMRLAKARVNCGKKCNAGSGFKIKMCVIDDCEKNTGGKGKGKGKGKAKKTKKKTPKYTKNIAEVAQGPAVFACNKSLNPFVCKKMLENGEIKMEWFPNSCVAEKQGKMNLVQDCIDVSDDELCRTPQSCPVMQNGDDYNIDDNDDSDEDPDKENDLGETRGGPPIPPMICNRIVHAVVCGLKGEPKTWLANLCVAESEGFDPATCKDVSMIDACARGTDQACKAMDDEAPYSDEENDLAETREGNNGQDQGQGGPPMPPIICNKIVHAVVCGLKGEPKTWLSNLCVAESEGFNTATCVDISGIDACARNGSTNPACRAMDDEAPYN